MLSTRDKPDAAYCRQMFQVMEAHDVRYFFYIGGNDSADTVRIVNLEAEKAAYELRAIHIPKTIDNDLAVNDHTPGYGSAARFVVGLLRKLMRYGQSGRAVTPWACTDPLPAVEAGDVAGSFPPRPHRACAPSASWADDSSDTACGSLPKSGHAPAATETVAGGWRATAGDPREMAEADSRAEPVAA